MDDRIRTKNRRLFDTPSVDNKNACAAPLPEPFRPLQSTLESEQLLDPNITERNP